MCVCVCVRVRNNPEFADEVVRYSMDLKNKLAKPPPQPKIYSGDPCDAELVRELHDEDPSRFEVLLKDGGTLPLIAVMLSDSMGILQFHTHTML